MAHRAEACAPGFGEELRAARLGARVNALVPQTKHLRDELDGESLGTCTTVDATIELTADDFSVAVLGAKEHEATVPLLHLVAELNFESLAANAAALRHSRHGLPLVGARAPRQEGNRIPS